MPSSRRSRLQTPPRAAARRWLVAGLLLVLLGMQTLGFVHRVAHAGGPASTAGTDQGEARAERPPGMAALFAAHHDDDSGCRLFDGIGHQCFLLPAALLALALLAATGSLRLTAGAFIARHAAPFEARAPPLSR